MKKLKLTTAGWIVMVTLMIVFVTTVYTPFGWVGILSMIVAVPLAWVPVTRFIDKFENTSRI